VVVGGPYRLGGRLTNNTADRQRRVALAEAHRGASGTQERHGGPAVAGDDGPVGPEALAERLELLGCQRPVELPGEGIALPDAEVVDRPDVEAS